MATWPTPRVWVAGERVGASKMNEISTALSLLQIPVGGIIELKVATNPATLLGYGTWASYGPGMTTVGIDPAQIEFDTVDKEGGAKTHALTSAENGTHTHTQNAHNHELGELWHIAAGTSAWVYSTFLPGSASQNTTAVNQNSGSGSPHNNLQPYKVVYRWVRTA